MGYIYPQLEARQSWLRIYTGPENAAASPFKQAKPRYRQAEWGTFDLAQGFLDRFNAILRHMPYEANG